MQNNSLNLEGKLASYTKHNLIIANQRSFEMYQIKIYAFDNS